MKIKAVDIARQLGISKATVSLALNGKSGVSSETRDMILKCREEMESQLCNMLTSVKDEEQPVPAGMTIKIIMFDRKLGIICAPALNIWTEMLRIFDGEARKHGYSIGITYVGNDEMEIQRVVEECNSPAVAGVLLYATEMAEHDFDKGLRLSGNQWLSLIMMRGTGITVLLLIMRQRFRRLWNFWYPEAADELSIYPRESRCIILNAAGWDLLQEFTKWGWM